MTVEQICQIGKVKISDENIAIINQYKDYIIPWLSSDEFKTNYAKKEFPPLINPAKLDYEGSNPAHAWVLNLPLPAFYDFLVFGSHAVGLHGAMIGFFALCGVTRKVMALRGGAANLEDASSQDNYERMFKEIINLNKLKQTGRIKHFYLQLSDLVLDDDTKKLYSLIDASSALHIVRDPISVLKGMAALPHRAELLKVEDDFVPFGMFLHQDPFAHFSKHIFYMNHGLTMNTDKQSGVGEGKEMDFLPDINSAEWWLLNYEQTFHDGIMYQLLAPSLKNIKLKQTTDFVGEKCFESMCELADHFGFNRPKQSDRWLFEKRVSDLKHLTPMKLYAHENSPLYTEQNSKEPKINKELVENSIKITLTTRFDGTLYILPELDISSLFELADPVFAVIIESQADALKLLKSPELLTKIKIYIKDLSHALLKQAKIENTKKLKENDVLAWFEKYPKMRQVMSFIMKQHLLLLRTHKPEIIEGYKYYQEFLKLSKDDEPLDLSSRLNGKSISVTNF
ncbi:MAG: DUF2972 domain-containing protein [Campylobacter sp.]|uniref:DUF2972 domain-containing protein n=1 Tax=Campylobacter sp. TaxID=205 RepID=UPI002A831A5B|nr:DUF2972 domain-containing protein [Campylobacter sp.]MCI7587126.1 DUF2972 domain-containing protein [Campylobacter sp.]MDY5114927.1 DUF2972 domain-containing protein [Campylobacter sp.]